MTRGLVRAALWVAITTAPAAAQARFDVSAVPFFGSLDPRGGMTHARILMNPTSTVSYDEVRAMVVLGGAFHIDDNRSPLGVRVAVVRSFGGEETGQWGCLPEPDGGPAGCPDILIMIPTDVTVTAASASLTGRVPAGPLTLRGDVGAGWVRHAYTWETRLNEIFTLQPGRATRSAATMHFGVGAGVPLRVGGGSFTIRYEEIRALSGEAEGRTHRWSAFTAGVELPILR